MKRIRFIVWKSTVVIAVMSIALIPSIRSSQARVTPAYSAGADLANEARVIGSYFEDLVSYDKQITDASKKARLVSSDLEPLERRSSDLKRRLSDVQNAVKDIIRKLKASGEWDNLDALLLTKISDARLSSHFRQNSFKSLLDESSTQLTSGANELSVPIDRLRAKLSARTNGFSLEENLNRSGVPLVTASYAPSAPFWKASWGCRFVTLKIGVQTFVRGEMTDRTFEQYECACTNTNCMVW